MSTATAVHSVTGKEVPAAGTWQIDGAHSSIEAVARHLVVSKVRGRFEEFSGSILVAEPVEDSVVEVEIDAASINTSQEDRDGHLRSGDFLDVDNHPTIAFRSTSVEPAGEAWKVHGDLTIRGVSKPVTLDVEFLGVTVSPMGPTIAMFSAATSIAREDWGITWNAPMETGGVLVSKTLQVELEIQAALT